MHQEIIYMQESLVRDDSIAFLTYLQQQYGLQGYELQRHIDRSRVQEQEAPKPAVFMSSDQLKEMEQKNPYLAKFQQRLGLDLD